MKRTLLTALALTAMTAISHAQLLAWNFTGENSGPVTSTAEVVNAGLDTTGVLSRGAGAQASTANNSFRTTGFQNNGISTSNTDYFTFTMSADPGSLLSVSSITASFAGTATYHANAGVSTQWAYSLDGAPFTLIGSATMVTSSSLTNVVYNMSSISALQNVNAASTITFRFYSSGQTSTGGWGFFSSSSSANGLSVAGSIAPVPEPSTYAMLIAGAGLMVWVIRRKRKVA